MKSPNGTLYGMGVCAAGLALAVAVILLGGCGEVAPSPATGTAMFTAAQQHDEMAEVVIVASRH
jgi:hypothetical protein